VPTQRHRRQRLGSSTCPADRLAAEHPDHVWALDYQFDQTQDGRRLKLLNVVDEHTREALTIAVDRRIDADETVKVWARWSEALAHRRAPSMSTSMTPAASASKSCLAAWTACCKVAAR
jgi:hypothetical protein